MNGAKTQVDLIIRPKQIIDGAGNLLEGMEVLVTEGKIAEVRPSSSGSNAGKSAEGLKVVDAPGATLLPGLIDLHMHIFQWEQRHDVRWEDESILEAGVRGVRNASRLLNLGVTTVRDVASRDNLSIQLRDLINRGFLNGPRFFSSGTHLQAKGRANYFFKAIDINGPDEARAAARAQMRAGADWIKIMATSGVGGGTKSLVSEPGWQELTEDEIRAAANEAHGPGRFITAHAIGNAGIKAALRAGVDCIEHGNFLDDEAIELMLANDVSYVPTLIITRNLGEHGAERGFESNIVERAKKTLEAGFVSVQRAYKAGVRIGSGSDVDWDETVAKEIRMLIESGLSPMDAISASTGVAARILHRQDSFGRVMKGQAADLILVDGDPLTDPGVLDHVTHVIQGGELVKEPGRQVPPNL